MVWMRRYYFAKAYLFVKILGHVGLIGTVLIINKADAETDIIRIKEVLAMTRGIKPGMVGEDGRTIAGDNILSDSLYEDTFLP